MERDEILDLLVEHAQNPHNYGELEGAQFTQSGGNPGCGDVVTLYLQMNDATLERLTFTGQGCTISQAATSLLTDQVNGMTLDQILELDYRLIEDSVGKEVVEVRPKCATLGLDTLKAAARRAKSELAQRS